METCPYDLLAWSRTYQPGDFFDAAGHFGLWRGFAQLRWVGSDGRFYCDLYLNQDDTERKTGHASFTREQIETTFDLCGGPTCRAEIERRHQAAS